MQRTASWCLSVLATALLAGHTTAQASWARQSPLPYPPQLNAFDIAFGSQRGYIVGSNTGLLETTDQGLTWHERVLTGPVWNEGQYYAVTFHDAQHGWLVGQKATWTNACFRTSDGGVSWQQMASLPGADWNHVDFVSPSKGWAGTWGLLVVTNDGGATWTPQPYGASGRFDAMAFRDASVGLIASAGAVRRTADGGQSWSVVFGTTAHSIVWLDATTVIASTNEFGSVADFARSTDAGVTWQNVDVPNAALQAVVRVDATTVIAGTPDGDIYRSTDAGLTWNEVWAGAKGTNVNGGIFTSPLRGFVLEAGNLILVTEDGGLTWSHASNGIGMEFEDIGMWDSTRGLACAGGGTIVRTVDAGHTWTPTRPGWTLSNGSPLMDLSLVAPDFAFAAGDDGTMVKTLDGGASWQAVQAPTGYPNGGFGDYWACKFVSPLEGWIGGGFLEISHTTDGGATWQQQFVGGSSADGVFDIDFVDALHGWVVGTFPGVLRTVDGGGSWVFHAFPGSGPWAWAVDFVNPSVGWASGRYGYVARSTDGGVTWTQQAVLGTGTATNVMSMHAISATECWVASEDDGRVFHTTNAGAVWSEVVTPFHDYYDGYEGIAVAANGDVWVAGARGTISRFGAPLLLAETSIYGTGCGGTGGLVPAVSAVGLPRLGNPGFAVRVGNGFPFSIAVLAASLQPGYQVLDGCPVLLSAPLILLPIVPLDGAGAGATALPIPFDATLLGVSLHAQYFVVDPSGPFLALGSLSEGIRMLFGY
jgi:photosystem II stability/assembly factor-like uncharacterized protein